MRVLICGGREYGFSVKKARYPIYRIKPKQVQELFEFLDEYHAEEDITAVAEGCAGGADFLGGIWAASRGIELSEYEANWDQLYPYGRSLRCTPGGQMKDLFHALRGELATLRDPFNEHEKMRDWLLLQVLSNFDARLKELESKEKTRT